MCKAFFKSWMYYMQTWMTLTFSAFLKHGLTHQQIQRICCYSPLTDPRGKPRAGDTHGGVMLYVKEGLHCKRRDDLEIQNIESVWIEIANSHKRILVGLFYRPPNSTSQLFSNIEDSTGLAVDTGINDIILTGDFNLNMNSNTSLRKNESICSQFSLYQSINEPTHFTERSSSIIDLLFMSNKESLIDSSVRRL